MICAEKWKQSLVICIAVLSVWSSRDVWAYTYAYQNSTNYPVRVIVHFYEEADRSARIEAKGSHAMSTPSLLKTWDVEAFLDNRWIQVLHLTCDVLPGDHTFSIYVKEGNGGIGETNRSWGVVDRLSGEPTGGQ